MPGEVNDSRVAVDAGRVQDRGQGGESSRRRHRVGDLEGKNVHVALIGRRYVYKAPLASDARGVVAKRTDDAGEHRAVPGVVGSGAVNGRDEANTLDGGWGRDRRRVHSHREVL